jgi:ATP-dependent DNA helicase RecG
MMRLIQGDVGCGKTVVAAAAALTAISSGYQVAIMAPTELLAEQHRDNFQKWFQPLGINVAWLTGSITGKARAAAYEGIAAGHAQLIIGTHALFQDAVAYHKLGLVIVDEQHRFGVEQRLSLIEKSGAGKRQPHQLVMTATPIPRTLAMTLYADLDTSVIAELPPGRTPVITVAVPEQRRGEVVARIKEACKGGQRAYWVCPLIDDSEVLDYSAAETTFAMLQEALPELAVGLIHGRMKAAEKDRTMKAFAEGKLNLLVATTVIEVGVDVPEATLMVIENAERMGLSQLHQLRGRVGRGADKSACVLMYKSPLSNIAHKRLNVMRETNDGFVVAQQDLELRGPGEVLGKRQTGAMQLRVADLIRDADLLPAVQSAANAVLQQDENVAQAIIDRWIGNHQEFVKV